MRRATRPAPEAVGTTAAAASAARAAGTATADAAPDVAVASARPPATPPATPGASRALIWRLQSGGWTSTEAGNLAAIALGLKPARSGWTGSELDHLRFLRSLVDAGRIGR